MAKKRLKDNISKDKAQQAKPKKKRRLLFFIVLIAVILALIFFLTRFYLIANLLLGNDIVVMLSVDKDILNLKHFESEKINFDYYILANPFCTAECNSDFTDLSKGYFVQRGAFTLKPALINSREYNISADKIGKGQDIYRFDISCHGISNFWCRTTEQNRTRSILVTVNYDLNDDEQKNKNLSKILIEQEIQMLNSLEADITGISLTLSNITSIEKSSFVEELDKINKLENSSRTSAYQLKERWENQEYDLFPPGDVIFEIVPSELTARLNSLNKSIAENISIYNTLINNLTATKQSLEQLKQINITNETLIELNTAIDLFNSAVSEFSNISSIEKKEKIVETIFIPSIIFQENASLISNDALNEIPQKINLIYVEPLQNEVIFKEPSTQCCLFGECRSCCENCSDQNYPIIFLHGHAFNKDISAEYSLETFQAIQQRLEEEKYLNAGSVLISSEENAGIWSMLNFPLTVRASYYFDLYKNQKESSIIQTKSDSIDTYAIRLKDIISAVKYKTGKNKVIIVAHSMGGLVSRKYIQIFGANDIDRLILIGSPNHGIDSNIEKLCSIVGESLECRDLSKDSLFINKLSYASLPNIPIYNIVGIGCQMENETGDGIVRKSSAYLEGAENHEINGSCDELKFSFLHKTMINPEKYPEVYQLILDFLKQNL